MAITIGSPTDLKGLATTFQTAINAIVEAESEPIKRVQTQRDEIDVRKGIYTDIKSNLDALQGAVLALISTEGSYGLGQVAKASVLSSTAGATVISATAAADATIGDYDFVVTALAKAQTLASTSTMANPDLALGKSGTFWMGGNGTAAANLALASDVLTGVATSDVASGQKELGTGTYSLQTRENSGVLQFRLVDSDGNAVSIKGSDGATFTSSWQTASSGSYDTGRGLSLTIDATGTSASTELTYTAKGVSVEIATTDTQRLIAAKLNAAVQPEGRDFTASIVSGRLVLTGKKTGVNHTLLFTDGAGLGLTDERQAAQNATFTVNGLTVSRATNSGLTDVIDGVTLNLAVDAEGKAAKLSIAGNTDKAVTAMNAFVNKFNAAFSHLTQKMALTSKTEGTKTTYTRGPLSGDMGFRGLRMDLFNQVIRPAANNGSFKSLADIGISYDKDMKLSVDAAKFTAAMTSSSSDTKALLDSAMGQFKTLLSRHTGSNGFLQSSLTSMDGQIKGFDQRITRYTESLTARRQGLIDQYFQYQTQLANLGYEAQMFGINLTGSGSSSVDIFR